MKKNLLLFLATLTAWMASAQEWTQKYDKVGEWNNGLACVQKGNRYGYVDTAGTEVVPCKFSAVGNFNPQGYVWVNKGAKVDEGTLKITGGLYGVYNREGKVIVPVKYKYLGTFNSERSPLGSPYKEWTEPPKEKTIYIAYGLKETGKRVEQIFAYGRDQSIVCALYNYKYVGNLSTLNLLSAHDAGEDIHEPKLLSDTLFSQLDLSVGNWFTVSNKTRKIKFTNGLISEYIHVCHLWGIVDNEGILLLPPDKYDMICAPTDGWIPIATSTKSRKHISAQLLSNGIQHKGKEASKFTDNTRSLGVNYYNIATKKLAFKNYVPSPFIAPVENERTRCIIDTAMVPMVSWLYMDGRVEPTGYNAIIHSAQTGRCVVLKDRKFGLANDNLNLLLQPEYCLLTLEEDGLMWFERPTDNGLIGLMDASLHVIKEPQYIAVNTFSDGSAPVVVTQGTDTLCGRIDKEGRTVLATRFRNYLIPSVKGQNIYWMQEEKGGDWYAYRAYSDHRLFEEHFDGVRDFGFDIDSVAFVVDKSSDKKKWGIVNTYGEMLIPCLIEDFDYATKIYRERQQYGLLHWRDIDTYRETLRQEKKLVSINETIETWDY